MSSEWPEVIYEDVLDADLVGPQPCVVEFTGRGNLFVGNTLIGYIEGASMELKDTAARRARDSNALTELMKGGTSMTPCGCRTDFACPIHRGGMPKRGPRIR